MLPITRGSAPLSLSTSNASVSVVFPGALGSRRSEAEWLLEPF
jgi:hypothetical protein